MTVRGGENLTEIIKNMSFPRKQEPTVSGSPICAGSQHDQAVMLLLLPTKNWLRNGGRYGGKTLTFLFQNFKHIANAATRCKVERICREVGYEPPIICTPQELMEV